MQGAAAPVSPEQTRSEGDGKGGQPVLLDSALKLQGSCSWQSSADLSDGGPGICLWPACPVS